MGGIGLVLGGALEGLGAGLHDQAVSDTAKEARDVEARRSMALANLQAANTQANTRLSYTLAGNNQREQVLNQDWLAGRGATRTLGHDITMAGVNTDNTLRVKAVEFSNEKALKALGHSFNLSEEDNRSANQAARDATSRGEEVGEHFVAPDGTVHLMSKTGKEIWTSAPGYSETTKKSGDDDTSPDALLKKPGGIGGGKPAAAPAAAPAAPVAPQGLTFDKILTGAMSSQKLAGKSGAERLQAAIAVARAHGVPVPAQYGQ